MAELIRAAYEKAFTRSNRTALAWAAFQAGWQSRYAVGGAEAEAQYAPEWSALDTHHASEAVGIRALPKPITWTELHKFAEEVARRAHGVEGRKP